MLPVHTETVGACRLTKDMDLPGQCGQCFRVQLVGCPQPFQNVLIQGDVDHIHGLFIADAITSVENGFANIFIGNDGDNNALLFEDPIQLGGTLLTTWIYMNWT